MIILIFFILCNLGNSATVCESKQDGESCVVGYFGDIECQPGSICSPVDIEDLSMGGICTPSTYTYDPDNESCEDIVTFGYDYDVVCKTHWGRADGTACSCAPNCVATGSCCGDAESYCGPFWENLCTGDTNLDIDRGEGCGILDYGEECESSSLCDGGLCFSPDPENEPYTCVTIEEYLQATECYFDQYSPSFNPGVSCEAIANIQNFPFTKEVLCTRGFYITMPGCSCTSSCVGLGVCCDGAVDYCSDVWADQNCLPEETTTTTTTEMPRGKRGKGGRNRGGKRSSKNDRGGRKNDRRGRNQGRYTNGRNNRGQRGRK